MDLTYLQRLQKQQHALKLLILKESDRLEWRRLFAAVLAAELPDGRDLFALVAAIKARGWPLPELELTPAGWELTYFQRHGADAVIVSRGFSPEGITPINGRIVDWLADGAELTRTELDLPDVAGTVQWLTQYSEYFI